MTRGNMNTLSMTYRMNGIIFRCHPQSHAQVLQLLLHLVPPLLQQKLPPRISRGRSKAEITPAFVLCGFSMLHTDFGHFQLCHDHAEPKLLSSKLSFAFQTGGKMQAILQGCIKMYGMISSHLLFKADPRVTVPSRTAAANAHYFLRS